MFEKGGAEGDVGKGREKVTGGYIILGSEEIYDCYIPPNISRSMKPRMMIGAGQVARVG